MIHLSRVNWGNRYTTKYILTAFFAVFQVYAFSQTTHLSGTIFDKETQMPVSAVSIYTKDNKTGTISTLKGKFSLKIPASKVNTYLYFTSIGYEPDSLLISNACNSLTIYLTPQIYVLKEVYIMPDSTLLTLLRKAYQKIPENYPDQPTRYESFFQHSVFNEKDSLIELIEAVLSVYKESYEKKKEMPGQVEIVQSRKKQLQNNPVGFVGGAFSPISDDIVLQRENYINPSHFKHFQYDFAGIKTLEEKDCYEIEFQPLSKDSAKVQGNLWIDVETLAYVAFEIHSERPENAKNILGLMRPVQSNTKINYKQQDGSRKWYLKQIAENYEYENVRLKNPLSASLSYITTSVQTDSVKPISFEKRLEYMDAIEAKTENYTPDGWTDSDILENESTNLAGFQFSTDEAASIFQQNISTKRSFKETLIQITPKLVMGYGIQYDFNQEVILSQMILGYRLNKKWSIQWQYTEDLYSQKIDWKENSLGFEFRKNLNNAGYPLFLGTSLSISDKSVKIQGDKVRTQSIVPQISLSKRTSRFITLEFFTRYAIPIHSTDDYHFDDYPQVGISVFFF